MDKKLPDKSIEEVDKKPSWLEEYSQKIGQHFFNALQYDKIAGNNIVRKNFRSYTSVCDQAGRLTLNPLATTQTITIQRVNGLLDGVQVSYESFSFTYPSNNIYYDSLHLFIAGLPLKITASPGDTFSIIESADNLPIFSDMQFAYNTINPSFDAYNFDSPLYVIPRSYFATPYTLGSTTLTANVVSSNISVQYEHISLFVNVSAVSGTSPTLNVYLDTLGGDGVWYTIASSPQITAVGQTILSIGPGLSNQNIFNYLVRVRYVLGGTTPSFTLSVSMVNI